MYSLYSILKGFPLLAVLVIAAADYPTIPSDLTTPTQQRLAMSGLNCQSISLTFCLLFEAYGLIPPSPTNSGLSRMEYLRTALRALRELWHRYQHVSTIMLNGLRHLQYLTDMVQHSNPHQSYAGKHLLLPNSLHKLNHANVPQRTYSRRQNAIHD